jgi:predicted ATPase/serine/threonine protein kinase
MALAAGTRLGAYEILSLLGRGGMGEVYRARDTKLRRDVALKILPATFSGDNQRLARFRREAQVLAALNHPSIGAIYGLDDAEGQQFLVLELVEGETLADRIRRGPLPLIEALAIATQIVDALESAHNKGIVHRDLKPANIKISPGDVVKLLDFGLAKVESNDASVLGATQASTVSNVTGDGVVGTFRYMSPEQARGQTVDRRTDIWAFGCVLYEMLAGRSPFGRGTTPDTLAAILESEPDRQSLPDATPPAIWRLVQRCLEKDTRRRLRDVGDARDHIADALSGRRSARSNHNLPSELTSFVGRRVELEALARLLGSSRLLSITGAGGVGKTRLALRLALTVVDQFADGVWLVDLAPIGTPDLVAQAIASAIGLRETPQRSVRDALLENLCNREILLVLDNCEHLVDVCAELAEALLRRAPALRIIATSRETLSVPGETVWRVASLSLPDAAAPATVDALRNFEATQLFIERAISIDRHFDVSSANADAIARICRRLDGIPLAIELASARIGALSVEAIESRLQDRFRLLTGGARTAVPRQRTLEAAVEWSYQLLSNAEREVLNRLSVFPAGWTLEAAERVCRGDNIASDDVADIVFKLVDKSLVGLERQSVEEPRYRLLETVRQYARERLLETGESARVSDTHFDFIFGEFHGALAVLQGHGQVDCLKRLWIERDNVRRALEWATVSSGRTAKGLELVAAMFWYWIKRGEFAEGRYWLERMLSLNVAADRLSRARALIGLARILYFQGHNAEVEETAKEALALGRQDGDAWVISWALNWLANAAFERRDYQEAAALGTQARDASHGEASVAGALLLFSTLALTERDFARAQQLNNEANDVMRCAGEIWGLGIGLLAAATMSTVRKDFESAKAQVGEALSLNEELEDPRGIAWSLEVVAGLLLARGQPHNTVRLWGATDKLLQRLGIGLPPNLKWVRDRFGEEVKASLGPDSFEAAISNGRGMSSTDAVAFARQQLQDRPSV